ncbi:hypothetical protein ACIQWR_36320 [Streptomyces sp. NPDC098789]|uniref:hypothetical protein n=1 Tax=Streptomyces sp. NPDC098789 TaxID=3366098 RepID=UPI00380A0CC2
MTRETRAGDVGGGRYQLVAPIASGGMGRVWKSSDLDDAAEEWARLVAPLVPGPEVIAERWFRAMDPVTELMASRYGRWACGWNGAVGEGDVDGGVVDGRRDAPAPQTPRSRPVFRPDGIS